MYKVIGETLMEGLYDAAALLGNVLKPWRVQIFIDSSGLFTKVPYFNTETKELVTDDSRMYPLEEDCEVLERERTIKDPRVIKVFTDRRTGEETKEDSRMSVENARTRDVKLVKLGLI
jgi:hypothetical protein